MLRMEIWALMTAIVRLLCTNARQLGCVGAVYVFSFSTAMAPAHRVTAFLLCFWGILRCLPLAFAREPESKVNYFNNLPARLFFFDNTTVRHIYNGHCTY